MNPVVILAFVCGLVVLWLIMLTTLVSKEKQFLHGLTKGSPKKDLTSVLKQLNTSIKLASVKLEQITHRIDLIEAESKLHFQKLGLVRFNPFADTGGDQSFSLCLLDQNNNGIVITSLHSRHTTRLYSKEIHSTSNNQAEYSGEEWQAYQIAKNYK